MQEWGRGRISDSGTWGPPDSSLCLWHLWHLLRYKYNLGGIYPAPSQPPAQGPGSFLLPETGKELGATLNCLSFPLHRVSVLVGAPKANTSQPGVLQGGAVYLCLWGTSPVQCTPIEFDSKGNPDVGRQVQGGTPGVGLWLGWGRLGGARSEGWSLP